MAGRDEFDFIKSRLSPLSQGAAGAVDLRDDGAILALGPGERLAVTADTLVEGRHFPLGEAPDLAARKALRANLSDLAAMGAKPFAFTASVVWPKADFQSRADGFIDGLAVDQDIFGVRLIGGDTVVADAPWSIAITAFGRTPTGPSLRRSGARAGDGLVVTGTIGDAGLGLQIANGELSAENVRDSEFLTRRFRLPEPRIMAGLIARDFAHAAIDISDGLLSEAHHLAVESGLCAKISLDRIPRSDAAERWLLKRSEKAIDLKVLASSGDDYELLLSAPSNAVDPLIETLSNQGVRATPIGQMTARATENPVIVQCDGEQIPIDRFGFTQF